MKQLHTYIFFISILLSCTVFGQDKTVEPIEPNESIEDTLTSSEKFGLRAGIGLGRLIRTTIDKNYAGFEILGDYRVYDDFYIAGEIGNESKTRVEENINTKGSGSYIRVGIDYNVYDNWYGMQNSIYVGFRYSLATFNQTLNNYTVYSSSNYFEDNQGVNTTKSKGLNANWVEFLVGFKVEIVKNLFLGANLSLRNIVFQKKPATLDNLYIPGFGNTNNFGKVGLGYGYSISYLVPFFKKEK